MAIATTTVQLAAMRVTAATRPGRGANSAPRKASSPVGRGSAMSASSVMPHQDRNRGADPHGRFGRVVEPDAHREELGDNDPAQGPADPRQRRPAGIFRLDAPADALNMALDRVTAVRHQPD